MPSDPPPTVRPGVVEPLPPERRRRRGEPVVLYSCCCCCCCCLHTLGAVIGAVAAGRSVPTSYVRDPDADAENLPSSQSLFWGSVGWLVAAVSLLVLLFVFFTGALSGERVARLVDEAGEAMLAGVLGGLIMLGPLVLLAGCAVMAVRVACRPRWRQAGRYWRDLREIAVYTVAGAVVGTGVMFVLFVLLTGG